ncbi:MAG TPA: dephospho-CoA kinase [Thermodesulfobacteriaceae bacterium]|nr:dephospho-CoA kinase [Thermodesulfobacteriaceae bacterium]
MDFQSSYQAILTRCRKNCKTYLGWPSVVAGLTGKLAAGKSTVADMLRKQGIPIVDTDALAREAVEPGEHGLEELVEEFGKGILNADGSLDRCRMREMILADKETQRRVEQCIHPYVFRRMDCILKEFSDSGHDLAVVEVPLLFEAGWEVFFDCIVTVTAPDSLCMERLKKRNRVSRLAAARWMAAQMPVEQKCARSDFVISNDRGLEELAGQVVILAGKLRDMGKRKKIFKPERGK